MAPSWECSERGRGHRPVPVRDSTPPHRWATQSPTLMERQRRLLYFYNPVFYLLAPVRSITRARRRDRYGFASRTPPFIFI